MDLQVFKAEYSKARPIVPIFPKKTFSKTCRNAKSVFFFRLLPRGLRTKGELACNTLFMLESSIQQDLKTLSPKS